MALIDLIRHVRSSFQIPVIDVAPSTQLLNSVRREFLVGRVLSMVNCEDLNFCNNNERWELFSTIITLLTCFSVIREYIVI